MIEALKLENCTPDVDIDDIMITQNEVNRPALQLAGYFDYFDSSRIQIIGHVEHLYAAEGYGTQCSHDGKDYGRK